MRNCSCAGSKGLQALSAHSSRRSHVKDRKPALMLPCQEIPTENEMGPYIFLRIN